MLIAPEELADWREPTAPLIVDLCDDSTHRAGHVPGAVHLDYETLLRAEPPILGLVPEADSLSRTLASIGVTGDRPVVAYDDEGNGRAGRLLWMLSALGHPAHGLLDGGLVAWRAANLALASGTTPTVASHYHANFERPELIASCAEVRAAIDDPGSVILDNRGPDEYRGDNVRAERAGHIPGAINLDWVHAMDESRDLRLRPVERLRADFEAAGVTPDKTIITHCQTHHRSSLTLNVLRYLGYPDVRGYAGSWSEWGNRADTPIVTGDA